MPYSLILILLPALAALVVLAVSRWMRAATLAGIVAVGLLWVVAWLAEPAVDGATATFGFSLALASGTRGVLLLMYSLLGLIFLTAWFWPAGRLLVPTFLVVMSPLTAALMLRPSASAAAPILLAACLLVPYLYSGRFAAAAPAWRYVLFVALALAPFALAHWLIESGGTEFNLLLMCLVSVVLLLGAGFPFHIWVGGLVRRAPLFGALPPLVLVQMAVVVLLFMLLDAAPAARASTVFQTAIRWSAVVTALLAAFMMTRASEVIEIVAYALLLDMGFLLTLYTIPGTAGIELGLLALAARFLSVLLISIGLGAAGRSAIQPNNVTDDRPTWLSASALARVFFVYGCLSIVGLPLTPGFAGRWAQLHLLALSSPDAESLIVIAGLFLAMMIAAYAVLAYGSRPEFSGINGDTTVRRGRIPFALFLFGLIALLSISPQPLAAIIARLSG